MQHQICRNHILSMSVYCSEFLMILLPTDKILIQTIIMIPLLSSNLPYGRQTEPEPTPEPAQPEPEPVPALAVYA